MKRVEDAPQARLAALGVETPSGWGGWTSKQRSDYVDRQAVRLRRLTQRSDTLHQLARDETFAAGPIQFVPSPDLGVREHPKYRIRGMFGPSLGLRASMIIVMPMASDTHIQTIQDSLGLWGPRRFLYELLKVVAEYGGDCELYLAHSKLAVGIDATAFEAWVRRTEDNPTSAWIAAGMLLGGPSEVR